jgi:hypothetical protein
MGLEKDKSLEVWCEKSMGEEGSRLWRMKDVMISSAMVAADEVDCRQSHLHGYEQQPLRMKVAPQQLGDVTKGQLLGIELETITAELPGHLPMPLSTTTGQLQ